jgi:hypothetical protein
LSTLKKKIKSADSNTNTNRNRGSNNNDDVESIVRAQKASDKVSSLSLSSSLLSLLPSLL